MSHAFLFDRILGTRPAFRPTIDISMDPPPSCQALLHHQQPHNLQIASGNDFMNVRKKFEHEATDPYSHRYLWYSLYRFHMDLRKVGSTRVDEPGLNPGLVLPFHMAANHCVRVASYSAKRWRF